MGLKKVFLSALAALHIFNAGIGNAEDIKTKANQEISTPSELAWKTNRNVLEEYGFFLDDEKREFNQKKIELMKEKYLYGFVGNIVNDPLYWDVRPSIISRVEKSQKPEEFKYFTKDGFTVNLQKLNSDLLRTLLKFSKKYKVNYRLVLTIAYLESSFGTNKSIYKFEGDEARYAMQVKPSTKNSEKILKGTPEDEIYYIEAGVKYLAVEAKTYGIDVSKSVLSDMDVAFLVASYHAGMPTVLYNTSYAFSENKIIVLYIYMAIEMMRNYKFKIK